jgi:hypothetical protein
MQNMAGRFDAVDVETVTTLIMYITVKFLETTVHIHYNSIDCCVTTVVIH